MKMCKKFYHTESEGHSQPWIVWFEKHNHGINLVVESKKFQDVLKVLFVLTNTSTISDSWSVDKVVPSSVCLKHILPSRLGSRLASSKDFIFIRTKGNIYSFPLFIGKGKPEVNIKFFVIIIS